MTTTSTQVEAPRAQPSAGDRGTARGAQLTGWLRRHSLFLAILVAGVVLRWLAQGTYQPALLYWDSRRYLDNIPVLDPGSVSPLGYTLALKAILHVVHDLAAAAFANHVFSLATAVVLYAVLVRRGVRPWWAALATAPVLLDAYELLIEQMVMSDILFQLLVVLGAAALLWWRRPGYRAAALGGLALGAAACTRLVGQPLVVAGVVFLLLAAGPGWRRLTASLVLVLGFIVPVGAYATYNQHVNGMFKLSTDAGARRIYSRTAPIADCRTLSLPSYERVLCVPPSTVEPIAGSLIEGYTYGPTTPINRLKPPPGMTESQVLRDFSFRVIRHQPLEVTGQVAKTFAKPFLDWRRTRYKGDLPVERWRFRPVYPPYLPDAAAFVAHWGGTGPAVDKHRANLLRTYQLRLGYTPGPFLLAALVLGVAGALGLGRARGSGLRSACLLFVLLGVGLLLTADTYLFSWRYQMPALVTLPPAGVLGLTALMSPRRAAAGPAVVTSVRSRVAEESQVERDALDAFRARHPGLALGPVVVVIPALDESESIGEVIDRLPETQCGLPTDVLVMSDGSTDGTEETARAHGAFVCHFETNVGQGVALRQGYRLAREHGARYLVTTDADGQYDADDIPTVLQPVVDGEADFVIGSRRLGHHETDDPVRHLGVRVFARLVNLLTGAHLTDTSSGLRAFTAQMTAEVPLTQPQYQTSELLIGALARGYRVTERPSVMHARAAGTSKKGRNAVYGLRYARVILGTWRREWPGRAKRRTTRGGGEGWDPESGDVAQPAEGGSSVSRE